MANNELIIEIITFNYVVVKFLTYLLVVVGKLQFVFYWNLLSIHLNAFILYLELCYILELILVDSKIILSNSVPMHIIMCTK